MGFAAEQGGGFQQRRTGKPGGVVFTPANRGRIAGQGGEYVLGSFLGQFPRSAASESRENDHAGVSAKEFRAAGDAVAVIMVPETAARRTIQTKNCVSDLFKYGRFPDDGCFGPLGRPVRRSLEKEKISVAWGTGVA